MKNLILSIAIALMGLCSFAAADVQSLTVGTNVLVGGPGKVTQIEAVSSNATGTVTVKRVIDNWTYGLVTSTVTNSFTNAVAWTTRTATNRYVNVVDDYLVVTNAVYTNITASVTNIIGSVTNITSATTNYWYDTTRLPNGYHSVTNDIVVTNPVWTTSYVPFKTSTITNDVVAHAVYTNTIGTITIADHVGTLAPTNLYFTAGDVLVIESEYPATIRLYSENE